MRWPPPYLSTIGNAALLAGSALLAGIAGGLPGGLDADDVALALQMVVFVLVQPPPAGVARTRSPDPSVGRLIRPSLRRMSGIPRPLVLLGLFLGLLLWFGLTGLVLDGLDREEVFEALQVASSVTFVAWITGVDVPQRRRPWVWAAAVAAVAGWTLVLVALLGGLETDDMVFAAGYVVIVGVALPLVWRSEDRRRAREAEAAQEHPDVQVAPGSEIDPDATADT